MVKMPEFKASIPLNPPIPRESLEGVSEKMERELSATAQPWENVHFKSVKEDGATLVTSIELAMATRSVWTRLSPSSRTGKPSTHHRKGWFPSR